MRNEGRDIVIEELTLRQTPLSPLVCLSCLTYFGTLFRMKDPGVQ